MDARVKKDEYLENQKVTWTLNKIFDFLKVHPFSPKGFFTFLVALAHGVPHKGLKSPKRSTNLPSDSSACPSEKKDLV